MDAVNRQLTSPTDRKFGHSYLLYICFFLSGFAALIFQLGWQRMLLRILGSTLPAVSIVLSVFMAGLALGSFACGRATARIRNPLLCYAVLEFVVGVFGVLSLWLLSSNPNSVINFFDATVGPILGASDLNTLSPFNPSFCGRALLAGCLLLVPTTAMGATFPLVGKFLEQTRPESVDRAGAAYFVNLAGAACGTVCGGFFLMPYLGLSQAVLTASVLSFSVSALLWFFFKGEDLPESASVAEPAVLHQRGRYLGLISLVVLLNGAAGMILEVVWSRLFSLLVGSSTYSIAAVLSVCIVGLALGTAIFQKLVRRVQNHTTLLAILFCAIGATLYLDLWLIQIMPWLFHLAHSILDAHSYLSYLIERLFVISLVVLVPSLLSGGVFPVALHALANLPGRHNTLGLLYGFSAAGSVLGAILAGFLFIPVFGHVFSSGMESTVFLLIFMEVAMSVLLILWSSEKRILLALPLLVVTALLVRPAWNKSLMSSGIPFLSLPNKISSNKAIFDRLLSDSENNRLLFYREGLNTTVTVNANEPQNIVYLKNDGKVEAALPLSLDRPADTSDLTTHFMLGRIPISIGKGTAKRAFVIGLGSGATCGGALDTPGLEKLTVAEVEPTIFAVQHFFEPANGSPLRQEWLTSGRVLPICQDARAFLNYNKEKFDAIISQPAEPWISGSSDLYTLEFWRLARSKLNERGSFCQWIQLYAIDPEFLGVLCRTFQSVFPNSYVIHYPRAGEIILLGTIEPLDPGVVNSLTDLIATPDSLRTTCRQLGEKHGDLRLNTDDNMLTEYALPQRLFLSDQLIEKNLQAFTDKFGVQKMD